MINIIDDGNEPDELDNISASGGTVIFEKKGATVSRTTRNKRNKHMGPFRDDLRRLMYGYGDDKTPNE